MTSYSPEQELSDDSPIGGSDREARSRLAYIRNARGLDGGSHQKPETGGRIGIVAIVPKRRRDEGHRQSSRYQSPNPIGGSGREPMKRIAITVRCAKCGQRWNQHTTILDGGNAATLTDGQVVAGICKRCISGKPPCRYLFKIGLGLFVVMFLSLLTWAIIALGNAWIGSFQ